MGKLILVAAPSGAGKTTIVHHLLDHYDELAFSVSATTRPRRSGEREGEDYYFLHPGEFKRLIEEDAFLEWEEVYENQFYGTLRREIERLWKEGKSIIFDIDVKGALNIKKAYPDESLSIFIKPPSLDALRQRLSKRQTEDPENFRKRMARAEKELRYENMFDRVILNDDLPKALREAEAILDEFLHSPGTKSAE